MTFIIVLLDFSMAIYHTLLSKSNKNSILFAIELDSWRKIYETIGLKIYNYQFLSHTPRKNNSQFL